MEKGVDIDAGRIIFFQNEEYIDICQIGFMLHGFSACHHCKMMTVCKLAVTNMETSNTLLNIYNQLSMKYQNSWS